MPIDIILGISYYIFEAYASKDRVCVINLEG